MVPDHSHMDELTRGLEQKSAKIRKLAAEGYKRADIARFLGIRYQHVRNVLVRSTSSNEQPHSAAGAERPHADPAGRQEDLRATITVGPAGRIVIPAEFRAELGIEEGAVLIGAIEGGELRLATTDAAVKRAQAIFRKYVPEGRNVVDEFLAERRRMWGEG